MLTSFKNRLEIQVLNEINYGNQDGLTEEEFFKNFPQEEEEMKKDLVNYRYPRGESYRDVIERTERIIFKIERLSGPVVMVLKPSVFRCFYGYFAFEAEVKNIENIPNIEIPKNTIIQFTPEAYGFRKEIFVIDTRTGFRKLSNTFLQDMSVFYNAYKSNNYDSNELTKNKSTITSQLKKSKLSDDKVEPDNLVKVKSQEY